ncbi:MAG: terminase family protein [Pseudomonadales bacterium]|nr:terminase family protein [Pseudomonadales bacterium]
MSGSTAILLPYQQRWIEDRAPVKIIEKSRRIGLSYAEAADAVLHAAAQGGANVYYISYDKEMTSGFIQDCAAWARAFQAAASAIEESVIQEDDRQILTYTIHFDSGHSIHTFSSNPRNLRSKGRPGERLVIDEAAFVDNIEELLKSAMAMTMWGGNIRIISTHNGQENPFNGLINDIRAGRYDYSLHRVTLDDAIADGLYRRICQVTGQSWSAIGESDWREQLIRRYRPNEAEELFCVPAMGGGAYLTRALIESCTAPAPVIRFVGDKAFNSAPEPARAAQIEDWIREELLPHLATGLDPQLRHALGMDFARSSDMSVIAPISVQPDLSRRVPLLVEMHNMPHKQQEQVLFAVGDRLPRLSGVGIDAGGNGSYIAESAFDRWGSLVDQVRFTEDWYRQHMPRYKARFEDRTITIPQHDDVVEDHRAFRMVNGVARLPKSKTDQAGVRHGDSAIAIVLADAAADMDVVEGDFIPVPRPGSAWRGDRGHDADEQHNDMLHAPGAW